MGTRIAIRSIPGLRSSSRSRFVRVSFAAAVVAAVAGLALFAPSASASMPPPSEATTPGPDRAARPVATIEVAAPTTATAGRAFTLVVTVRDAGGELVPGYRGTVTLTSSDRRSKLPGRYTFTPADRGGHRFAGLALRTAGPHTIVVKDSSTTALAATAQIVVAPGATTRLAVSNATRVRAGEPFAVTVRAKDAYYNVTPGYRGTVAFAASDTGSPVLPAAYTFTRGDRGVETFRGVELSSAGVHTVAVTDTTIAAITGTGPPTQVAAVVGGQAVRSWGGNEFGAVGDGTRTDRATPVAVLPDERWTALAAGANHTLAVRADGTLWAWGLNSEGQLGDGSLATRLAPVQVGTGTQWVSAAAGYGHSLAIRSDGSLWSWGLDSFGQLGDGAPGDIPQREPRQVGRGTRWATVVAGFYHSLALSTDGKLWAWGYNGVGQLGLGTFEAPSIPARVGTESGWRSVSTGPGHTVAVKADGSLWSWGDNTFGELGDGTTSVDTPRVVPGRVGTATRWAGAAAGNGHSAAVTLDGELWTWGDNAFGQLGHTDTVARLAPARVGTARGWSSVASSQWHTAATKTDGSLWAWGAGTAGQLGDGASADRWAPVRLGTGVGWTAVVAGLHHTVALTS